jgi:23S rRNA-/tRNA-specific pseudouridylate synthase
MFAKNTKAASRVQKAWSKGQVMKEYLCVVEATSMQAVRNRSNERKDFERWAATRSDVLLKQCEWGSAGWRNKEEARVLTGIIRKRSNGSKGSVMVESIDLRLMEQMEQKQPTLLESGIENSVIVKGGRLCHLEYRHLASFLDRRRGRSNQVHLVSVRTATGARHQVRALLSAVGGSPIVGDLRYGSIKPALRDQSVALHARSLYMPTVKLGGTDLISSPFTAPIPSVWQEFFALSEDDVHRLQD